MKTIQDAQAAKSSLFVIDLILRPLSKGVVTQTIVADTFADAMSVLETQLSRIRLEAEATAVYLNNLEQSLSTMHELLTRENVTMTNEKEELLAELWTRIHGNRRRLKGMNDNLHFLEHVGVWRKRARSGSVTALTLLD